MSQKSQRVVELMARVKPEYELPDPSHAENLLEFGLLCILARRLKKAACGTTLKQFQGAFVDWNELRVAQVQEIRPSIQTKDDRLALAVARDVKTFLQEVFQTNHGFDLEFLRDDATGAAKFVGELFFLGGGAAHDLLLVAADGLLPATPGVVRVFDRLGLAGRTGSIRKAREALGPLVPKGKEREFSVCFGSVADRWCDSRKPTCHECPFLDGCPHGAKIFKDWQAQQKRLEAQRIREEARAVALAKKEEARRLRDEERDRKRREADEQKRKRAAAKTKRERERAMIEQAKKRAKLDAVKKRQEERKKAAEAKKKAAASAKKKAAAKKQADAKKAAEAKKKKTAAKKKSPAKKKAVKKKATKTAPKKTTKKSTAKKSTTKKKTTKTSTAKKKPAAKKVSKKKVTKKTTSRRKR